MRSLFILCCLAASSLLPVVAGAGEVAPVELDREQITFQTGNVRDFAVSPDGGRIVAAVEDDGFTRLVAVPLGGGKLPEFLSSSPAGYADPAFSADGRRLAFVSDAQDAKGDIFLLAPGRKEPLRLTDAASGDASPSFSPDGSLYFQMIMPGGVPSLARVVPGSKPQLVPTGRDVVAPVVSPDGRFVAFVSFDDDPAGDIYLLDLEGGQVRPLVVGPNADRQPAWTPDGDILFTRVHETGTTVWRVGGVRGKPAQLTVGGRSARHPRIRGENLYFLSAVAGGTNVFRLPAEGEIRVADSAAAQAAIARRAAESVVQDDELAVAAYRRTTSLFPDTPSAWRSSFALGLLLERMGRIPEAREAFSSVSGLLQEEASDRIRYLDALKRVESSTVDLAGTLGREVRALRRSERASGQYLAALLLERFSESAEGLRQAMRLAGKVASDRTVRPGLRADAALLEARLSVRFGADPEAAYVPILRAYGQASADHSEAVRLAAVALLDALEKPGGDSVERLTLLAARHGEELPGLAAAATNRVGDLLLKEDETPGAKAAYASVLSSYPEAGRATAAARLALAELLYREGRYAAAVDLYERAMAEGAREDGIYRLARAAYLARTAAAGDRLLQNGEVPAARSLFADLVRTAPEYVPGHRGWIRASVSLGRRDEAVSRYRVLHREQPTDPVALYALGLAVSYADTEAALREAREIIRRAIALGGRTSYYFRTLGFLEETLETAYAESGGLERALVNYEKAWFLASDVRDRAELALNLGNVNLRLGRSLAAYRFYLQRLEAGVPFISADTELLFYRHLGMAAFRADDPARTVEVFYTALELVRDRIRPLAPSVAFGKLSEAVRARALRPAAQEASRAARAEELAVRQAEVDRQLAEAGAAVKGLPPSDTWRAYRDRVAALLKRERAIMLAAAALTDEAGVLETFEYLYSESLKALDDPVQLAEAEAELLNRLALALQDARRYAEAAETFRQTLDVAQRLDAELNLGMLTRSMAYNRYMQAGEHTGSERGRLLDEAQTLFRRARELVLKHGVPDRTHKSSALITINLETSLDEAMASRASGGFSAAQEVRLCDTFLARIALENGNLGQASAFLEPQLAAIGPDVPQRDVFEASVLLHRGGLLDNAMDDPVRAFERFARSAELAIDAGSRPGAMINLVNMGHCLNLLAAPTTEQLMLLHRLTRQAAPLVKRAFPKEEAECRNTLSALLLALSTETAHDVEGRVLQSLLLGDAGHHLARAVARLDALSRPDRGALALRTAVELNLARLAARLGADPKPHFSNALALSGQGLLPRFRWRALAGLGRLDDALETLQTVPLSGLGCAEGEIVATFAPLVVERVEAGEVEDAFNLAERLLELERVNRMAPMVHGQPPEAEADFLVRAAPRILRIRALMAEAEEDGSERLRQLLDQEREILDKALGPDADRLPAAARLARGESARVWLTVLTGLDQAIERAADAAVKSASAADKARYAAARDSYDTATSLALAEMPLERPAGALGLFLPRPAQYFDVYLFLPQERALRLFFPDGSGGVLAFAVKEDMPRVERLASVPESFAEGIIPVLPDASLLPRGRASALSATQFVRAAWSLKPFRSRLMTVGKLSAPAGFRPLEDNRTETAQTLAVAAPSAVLDDAPVRPGVRGRAEPVIREAGMRMLMADLARDAVSLSSAAFADMGHGSMYAASHLFSLYGLPTFFAGDAGSYLSRLNDGTPEDAASSGLLLGHPGLTSQASAELARERFRDYVVGGQEAFRDGRFGEAVVDFAEALAVIEETPEYERYRPDALKFAREAAYRDGQLDLAADYAERLSVLVAEAAPDSRAHADALLKQGIINAAAGRYGEAVGQMEAATGILARNGGMLDEAEALAELGVVLENALKYRDALGRFDEAAEVADLAGADELLAVQHSNMGRVLDLRLDDYLRARRHYEETYEIHRAMGNDRGAAQALLDMGRCDRLMGDIQGAAESYEEALALTDDDALVARIVLEQANNAWFGADYQRAFTLVGRVLAQARESGDTLLEALGMNTSGMVWWSLGDAERALRDLDQALELGRRVIGREDVVASMLNNKGLVLREAGRLAEALDVLHEALAMDRRSGSRWGQAYALRNIARTHLEQGKAEAAWPQLEQALALTRAIGNRINEAKVLAVMGQVALDLGRADEAERTFNKTLQTAEAVGLPEVQWRAMHGIGLVARERGDLAAAEASFRRAVDIIESLRAQVAMQELRDGFAVGRMQPYEDLVRVLADQGQPRAAFRVAERSRARSLIEMLGNGRRKMRDDLGTELYNGLSDLKGRIREQQALIKRAELPEERSVYQETLRALQDRYRDMLLRARAENPELAGLVEAEPLDIPAVQALLEPDVSLLVYYLLDDEILCWTVTVDDASLARTPMDRRALEGLVLTYRRGLQNLEPVGDVSRRLHALLLGNVSVPDGTIGVVPHGILHHLSFAALDDGEAYFVDRHPLFRVPSASVMAYTFARRGKAAGPVLVAADPDVGVRALELPFARREGRAVAFNYTDANLLLGDRATKSEIVREMGGSRIVHIAAHGQFNRENPLLSTVKLAPGTDGDGDLDASEIFGINAPADLVVLSACQTGLSGISDGDDVIGLNRAFLFAGTHVLGASLWRVSDVASAILMKAFYRNLDTMTKSEALRRAMLHVRKRYPHPGYWAAFTLTGDHR